MKIKIGNFNFINNEKNVFTPYTDLTRHMNYFFLDGKEDTLYVDSKWKFAESEKNINSYEFERDLLKNYSVIDYNMEIENMINHELDMIALRAFREENYSRYDLYNNLSLFDIVSLDKTSKFSLDSYDSETIDFDKNRIFKGNIEYNPYTQKIMNLEDLVNETKFKNIINKKIINLEIENNKAPKFFQKLVEINTFLDGKQTVTVGATGFKPFKVDAKLGFIIDLRNNEIHIETSNKDFYKQNPDSSREDEYKSKLASLSYGKETLQFSEDTFTNLKNQIALTPKDKFLFKLDELESKIEEDYRNLEKENLKLPVRVEYALDEVATSMATVGKDVPDWYKENKKELDSIFEKYQAVKRLRTFETINNLLLKHDKAIIFYEFGESVEVFKDDENFQEIALAFKDTFENDIDEYCCPIEDNTEEEEDEDEEEDER